LGHPGDLAELSYSPQDFLIFPHFGVRKELRFALVSWLYLYSVPGSWRENSEQNVEKSVPSESLFFFTLSSQKGGTHTSK
jgi:hypothetical protein